jgi:membrane associated rhomboid family serine protease
VVRIRLGDEEIELGWDEWEERVREGRVPGHALVRIEALTGDEFVPASTLESWSSLSEEAARTHQREVDARRPPIVTALLIGAQIRIWAWTLVPGPGHWLGAHMLNFAPSVLENRESWRLIASGLYHEDPGHIFMNMVFLAYSGWSLEGAVGWRNLLALYFASVIGGSALSIYGSPWTPSLGASGGIMGLMGACVALWMTRPEALPEIGRRTLGLAVTPFLIYAYVNGLFSEHVDNWCHTGGLITGALLSLVLDPEPTERRPRWNLGMRVAITALCAVPLVVVPALGARLDPLFSETYADQMVLDRSDHEAPPEPEPGDVVPPPPYAALDFRVPAGWERGIDPAGDLAWTSPVGDRAFAVGERTEDAPTTVEAAGTSWIEALRRGFPEARVQDPVTDRLAGRDAALIRATVPGRQLEWRGVVRGRHVLACVWSVDDAAASRLAPLRDRLLAQVAWADPENLVDARRAVEALPDGRVARAALANALADVGDGEQAIAIARELATEDPSDETIATDLLRFGRWYPAAMPDRDAERAARLAHPGTPKVVVEVATSLDADGEPDVAAALLELAWRRSPGDRTLRRALHARSLSTDLEPTRNIPWESAIDAAGEPLPPDAVAAALAAPLTLDEARRLVPITAATRELRAAAAISALDAGDPAAVTRSLLLLDLGHDSADPKAVNALAEDLRGVAAGRPPDWMPFTVAAAATRRVTADPGLPDAIAARAALPGLVVPPPGP